uniref:Uncharacterized protein n=1 Tax=Anopheles minimus TaxID=112268 RepID=A0A182VX33_9DIPT
MQSQILNETHVCMKRKQIDKAPSEATFRGTEFLSYDLGQTGGEPIVSAQDAITLYFRTRQPNGLLFYTGKCSECGMIKCGS